MVLVLVLAAAAAWAAPPTVQVKEASLYAKPSPTSKFLGKITLGTVLKVLDQKDGWARVSVDSQNLTGWLRSQTFTTKAVSTKATGDTGSGVSATEVSLAGRGFTEQIESDYRTKNPALDFATLDRMEADGIPDSQLTDFLQEGGLKPRGDQ